ncbi:MAG: DUF5343 domain-containing protein [Solirubrobacteraceae bacterium]
MASNVIENSLLVHGVGIGSSHRDGLGRYGEGWRAVTRLGMSLSVGDRSYRWRDTIALPTAYLMTVKNAEARFNAIRAAKAPPKFTQRFLEDRGFKSTSDRLYIYYEFLDQSQSGRVLADALEAGYADLFQLRRDAQNMERPELKGKIKTLTQGRVTDAVVDKMARVQLLWRDVMPRKGSGRGRSVSPGCAVVLG